LVPDHQVARWYNMSSGQISDQINSRTCSGTLNRSSTAVRGSIWLRRARCSPSLAFATPFVYHTTQTLKVPKLVHLRFQQISDRITISSCFGALNRSATAVRGWICPHRARCSPSLAFATPFALHTTPDPQSTKVGASEISADFRPNNSRRGVQPRATVRNHRGVGESVPEPQRFEGL
jgi:hypothetical protein